MAHCVFIHRADSIYDDSPTIQYQFPKQYFGRAQACVGDWIIYYEPTKVRGTRGYYAVAKVQQIVPDPSSKDMYLALIEPGEYCEFPEPVPFMLEDGLAETELKNSKGGISGRRQSAVRALSEQDFVRIYAHGMQERQITLPRLDINDYPMAFEEEHVPFIYEQDRSIVNSTIIARNKSFRRLILRAYNSRCAITGLKLINGGGRAEVEAAHIKPVEEKGPDSVGNGLALSGTVHWMFDRGLLSLSDELEIIVSRHVNDRDGIATLINSTGRLIGPDSPRDRPHPAFLSWHREFRFKA